jgi:hypothetical protein
LVSIEHASQTALDFRPLGSCLMDAAKDIAEKRARGVDSTIWHFCRETLGCPASSGAWSVVTC